MMRWLWTAACATLLAGCVGPDDDDEPADATPVQLLDWAEEIAVALRTRELHDFLEEGFESASESGCPLVTAASPALPLW